VARRIRRPLGPLDLRSQAILRAVIEEYVNTATPVGSQALVERYSLPVSSATVRNVLAELEVAGFLMHPHTSAGRMPTDLGYRYYVESIVQSEPLPAVEQLMIRHQFGQVEFASEHWFRLAATTLATATGSAGLATPAKPVAARLRRIDLVSIHGHLASLILVLREGSVKQQLINFDQPQSQETLGAAAALVNEHFADLTAAQIARRLDRFERAAAASAGPAVAGTALGTAGDARPHAADIAAIAARVGERVLRTMRDFDAEKIEEVFSDGLLNVLAAPEFAHSDKVRRVFSALENRAYLGDLVGSIVGVRRVHVFIGEENPPVEMREVSLVLAPYGQPGRAMGVVGVLGPTRMSYRHAIGTVSFVSGLLDELVDHLYA
jgi:heat-inducible transcriptional repressor